jgi:hypothetical protein
MVVNPFPCTIDSTKDKRVVPVSLEVLASVSNLALKMEGKKRIGGIAQDVDGQVGDLHQEYVFKVLRDVLIVPFNLQPAPDGFRQLYWA